jgi:hypothetical protein
MTDSKEDLSIDLERTQSALDHMAMEVGTAKGIAEAMGQSIEGLEKFWPPSKRGSNAQRFLDEIKSRRATIIQCLNDATR